MSKRLFLISVAVLLFLTSIFFAKKNILAQTNPSFSFSNNKLSVSTSMMDMAIEGAAIVYIKDKASGEVLVNTSAWTNRPSVSGGFMPSQSTQASFQQVDTTHGRLTYPVSSSQLIIDINVDASGEVVIQLTGSGSGIPTTIDLPMMNINQSGIILGSGAKYVRGDAATTDHSTHDGFESPIVAVVEGSQAVVGAWSETTVFAPEDIELQHKSTYDHLILQTKKDPKEVSSQKIVSSPWRIGTYQSWNKAARRWKVKFEERTGAKPLWQNRASWVRNIHAMYYGTNNYSHTSQLVSSLNDSSKINISPSKVLYFLWNGDRIVLFGDHTLAKTIAMPTPDVISLVNSNHMPMILYHPWTLIKSEVGASARLSELSSSGFLPTGYSFNPDYESTPNNWQNYWSDVKTIYYDGSEDYVLHPGSTKYKNYLVRNLGNYSSTHGAQGAYLDILGMDHGFMFPSSKKVIDGEDYILGEANAIKNFVTNKPDLGVMSEYLPQWLMPTVFYTWEGSETHLSWYPSVKVNHPLRVALTGSYGWTRDSNEKNTDEKLSALLGGLPEISLVGDYQVSDDRALWSQKRGKLFADRELFNDIPDYWDPKALAYYRSNNGNWVKFVDFGSTYGYVEELPDGNQKVLLTRDGSTPVLPTMSPQPSATPTSSPSPTTTPIPGDANGDGKVDGVDYMIWLNHYNTQTTSGRSVGDFNSDQKVDGIDYIIWLNNYS